jgi:hypothetical protein
VTKQPQPSAWSPLIDEWVEREAQLRPHLPVRGETVQVRDAVEVGDQAFVLVSFDVDHPWPAEEEVGAGATAGSAHTAVIQAERARQPWLERDSTRAVGTWRTDHSEFVVNEHVLGSRRALSGQVPASAERVTLGFDDGEPLDATVVDGWFLAVVPEARRVQSIAAADSQPLNLFRADAESLLPDPMFARSGGDAMYFSPLDLRVVHPIVRWTRVGDVVAVVASIEQYDDGGMLRLRVDGVRTDDDTFVSWPKVVIRVDGDPVASAVCGEHALADTISLDVGFKPWFASDVSNVEVAVSGLRGGDGHIEPAVIEFAVPRT